MTSQFGALQIKAKKALKKTKKSKKKAKKKQKKAKKKAKTNKEINGSRGKRASSFVGEKLKVKRVFFCAVY